MNPRLSTLNAKIYPFLSIPGWRRKLAYCIAFSADGAADVTRRYVRNTSFGLPRTRASEASLRWITSEICKMRRANFPKAELRQVRKRDIYEERELRMYTVQAIVRNVCSREFIHGVMSAIRNGKNTNSTPAVVDNRRRYLHNYPNANANLNINTNINTTATAPRVHMAPNHNNYVNSNMAPPPSRPSNNQQSSEIKVPENAAGGYASDDDEHMMDIDSGNGYERNGG